MTKGNSYLTKTKLFETHPVKYITKKKDIIGFKKNTITYQCLLTIIVWNGYV